MRGVSRESLAAVTTGVEGRLRESQGDAMRSLAGELFAVVSFLDSQPRLRRLASDPSLGADQRADLVTGLLGDRVSERAREVVDQVVKSAWSRPRDMVDALDEVAAQVLFAGEEQDDSLDEVEDELFRFGRILDREPGLRAALTDPSMPADRKQALLDGLLEGKVRPATHTLVTEVVQHPRGRTLDRGLDEYGRLAAARRDRLVAHVRTVAPLTDEQAERLEAALAAELGHRVHLNVETDPDLVGGITVRVGDELYDGSIAHRLNAVRRLMAG